MTPTARSLDSLAIVGGITAAFHPAGAGHHYWQLYDQFGSALARTERVHNGGRVAQAIWKLVSATGMDANNDIHVNLVGAEGISLARASSSYMKETVTVVDPSGRQVANSKRDKDTLTLYGAEQQVIAAMKCEGDGPWPVCNPAGDVLGELLAGEPGPSLSAPLWQWVVDTKWALNTATYTNAMHMGLRRVKRYSFAPSEHTKPDLALALLPLLCGLTY